MITVSDLTVKLNNITVIDGVSLEIRDGEFISVVGKNGSGKTTLARCLNGLQKPSSGTIRIGHLDATQQKDAAEIHRRVGMVFQNPDDQLVATTVETELAFGLENLGLCSKQIRERIEIAIDIFDLEELRDRPPQQLSGGEKQRLAIASSYTMYPDYLILDEPTALLDNHHQNQIMRQLQTLNNDHKIGLIVITHSPHEAMQAERMIILKNGRIVSNGSPEKIYNNRELLKNSGIEAPFATQLAHALNEKKIPLTIEDFAENWNRPIRLKDKDPDYSIKTALRHISIELRKVRHEYQHYIKDREPSLNDLSLKFSRGSLHAILGKSGSGKTTLAQHLNGLILPKSGSIFLNNENTKNFSVNELVRKVGLVFQFPELQLFAETIEDDVAFGPKKLNLCKEEIHQRIDESLNRVGLPLEHYGNRSPQDLSSGEKRRVAIAGVIAMNHEVIVLDEPTAGLDPETSQSLCKMMSDLATKSNKTVIWITHDVDAAARWANEMTVMARGQIAITGRTRDVVTDDDFKKFTGILPPFSVILYERLKSLGYVMPFVPITLDETVSLLS